jgi:hypothetical protein
MSDQPADLVLEQLRLLPGELAAMKTEMRSDFSDVKTRFGVIESALARIRRDDATDAEFLTLQMRSHERLEQIVREGHDAFDARLQRLEAAQEQASPPRV